MPHWIGILLLIAAGGLIFVFMSFGPTPDTYVIVTTSLASTPPPVFYSTTAKSSLHARLTAVSDIKTERVTVQSAPKVKVEAEQVTVQSAHKVNVSAERVTVQSAPKVKVEAEQVTVQSAHKVNVKTERVTVQSARKLNITESPSHDKGQDAIGGVIKTPISRVENIFFIESSCAVRNSEKAKQMNGRQGCAIESAALTNPNATVYYLETCGGVREFSESRSTNDRVLRQVLTYPNVKMYHVDQERYFNNTPLETWLSKGYLEHSLYPVEHSSDILRLVTLWKFGGVYLDLDFIVLRPLKDLKQNFVVAESDDLIANSVLSFSADGLGHEVVSECLGDLLHHFNGNEWGYNGPLLITRVMERLCNGATVLNMTPKRCKGFTVHRPPLFFPFYYPEWELLFDEYNSDDTMHLVLKNGTYGVHAWNKMSHGGTIKVGSKQPYALLASRFCPKVYSVVGKTF